MSLFGTKKSAAPSEPPDAQARLEELPVRLIYPNPSQPRREFDEGGIAELAASIKELGLIQPIIVRSVDGYFELVAGERRLRAVKLLGHKTVKCIVDRSLGDADSSLMAIVENLQREDLHFFDEAECYAGLIERLHITQEELAARVGKSQSFISNKLRLLKLSPKVRSAVRRTGLSERHVRAIVRLDENAQQEAVMKIARGGLSVKASERLVDSMLRERRDKPDRPAAKPRIIRIFKDYKLFLNTIDSACGQLRESGLDVIVRQDEIENGIEILIRVSQPNEKIG